MDHILDNEFASSNYENYREFLSKDEAVAFGRWLREHNIDFKIEEPSTLIDEAIVGTAMIPKAVVKVNTNDFTKVNQLLSRQAEQEELSNDHYLRTFTDLELFDVLKLSDRWNIEDRIFARRLLTERDYEVPEERVREHEHQKYQELKSGKPGNPINMIIYLLSIIFGVVFFHPLFFLAGIGMGWYYWKDTSTDPNGELFYTFSESTRLIGQIIFFTGILLVLIFGGIYLSMMI